MYIGSKVLTKPYPRGMALGSGSGSVLGRGRVLYAHRVFGYMCTKDKVVPYPMFIGFGSKLVFLSDITRSKCTRTKEYMLIEAYCLYMGVHVKTWHFSFSFSSLFKILRLPNSEQNFTKF